MDAPDRTWHRYVALGDSFTEGLWDGDDTSGLGGWADRLALALDADAQRSGGRTEYANLAVRGRQLAGVLGEQLPAALASGADLVSLAAGGNDILRPRADVDALAGAVEGAVAALRATGADVLLVTGFDPGGRPVVGWVRPRTAAYNLRLWAAARRQGAHVLDLWSLGALADARMWAPDRIHLSSEGHRRVALLARASLAGPAALARAAADGPPWEAPLPADAPRPSLSARARADAAWARTHLAPWVHRRLTGRSSGDGRSAKRPLPASPPG